MVVNSVEIAMFSLDPDRVFVEGNTTRNRCFKGLYIATNSI